MEISSILFLNPSEKGASQFCEGSGLRPLPSQNWVFNLPKWDAPEPFMSGTFLRFFDYSRGSESFTSISGKTLVVCQFSFCLFL